MTTAKAPREIWLGPSCEFASGDATWSTHDHGPCVDCGAPTVRYVRADLVRAAESDTIERAAKVAMDYAFDESWQHSNKAVQANAAQNIAAAIRALKQETRG